MSDLEKVLLTSSLTVLTGTAIYLISKIVIDTILEQRKVLGEILSAIINYTIICMATERVTEAWRHEASQKMLILSKELVSRTLMIPCYSFFEKLRAVSRKSAIMDAAQELYVLADLFLHSPIDSERAFQSFNKIKILLKIKYEF